MRNAFAPGRIKNLCGGVLNRERLRSAEASGKHVGGLSLFKRADFLLPLERASAPEGSRLEHVEDGSGGGVASNGFGKHGRQARFAEHVEFVVARSAVGADAEIDARSEELRDGGEARGKLQVGARAVAGA